MRRLAVEAAASAPASTLEAGGRGQLRNMWRCCSREGSVGVLGALRFDDAVLGMGVLCERFWGEGELEYELQKKVTAQAVADEFRVPAG